MGQIVILGSSVVGAKMIEEIRKSDQSSAITMITFDGHYPYKRDAFAPFIAKEIAPEEVFYKSKDFYEQHNVRIVFDQKISRINFNRKKIFTEEKQQYDYDVLIVTDTPENRYPNIKGTTKDNVYGYKKLKDIDQIVNALPVIKTIVIQSDTFTGLQAAASFIKRDKEVILVAPENSFLTKYFEDDVLEWLLSAYEEKGIRILRGNRIAEILGDKDAKAVKLQSGKVFSSEVILFMETDEDLRLFAGSSIKAGKHIEVNSDFKAEAEGVFAVDQSCSLRGTEPVTPLPVLEAQAETVAAMLSGQEKAFSMPVCVWRQDIEGLTVAILGCVDKEEVMIDRTFDRDSGTYKALYIKDNCLVGAILINKEDEMDELLAYIRKGDYFNLTESGADLVNRSENEQCVPETEERNVSTELIDN